MVIEDMQQSLELLENIKYFFYNIEEIEKKLNTDLRNKEYERDDLLHEIELSKLNAIEIMAVYKKLEKVLQERRIIKDKIDLVSTIKPYTSKFITKGICAETDTTIKNIETLKRNQENRQYTPRVLQDLKCAKKRKEKEKVQNTNQKFCAKCGNFTLDRITISVAKDGKSPRKLCNMCKNCYTDMLDHLGISDIKD